MLWGGGTSYLAQAISRGWGVSFDIVITFDQPYFQFLLTFYIKIDYKLFSEFVIDSYDNINVLLKPLSDYKAILFQNVDYPNVGHSYSSGYVNIMCC